MHHARLSSSPRLQRALRALAGRRATGGWMTTRQLVREAHVCAVNSVVAELRANGAEIEVELRTTRKGVRRYYYRLAKAP